LHIWKKYFILALKLTYYNGNELEYSLLYSIPHEPKL
jgi:hypothetical protein